MRLEQIAEQRERLGARICSAARSYSRLAFRHERNPSRCGPPAPGTASGRLGALVCLASGAVIEPEPVRSTHPDIYLAEAHHAAVVYRPARARHAQAMLQSDPPVRETGIPDGVRAPTGHSSHGAYRCGSTLARAGAALQSGTSGGTVGASRSAKRPASAAISAAEKGCR